MDLGLLYTLVIQPRAVFRSQVLDHRHAVSLFDAAVPSADPAVGDAHVIVLIATQQRRQVR
jgi:hypothetical protein